MKVIFKHHALGWMGTILVLYGYHLNANMDNNCWPIWFVGNVLVGIYCIERKAYPTAVMSFALVLMNIYGYLKWIN